MKRLLAFVTATLILALCLCVPASANCYVDEFTKTTPLWNADGAGAGSTPLVGKFEYDTQNQIEGAGCIGITFGNGPHFDATFPVSAADTANMSALEFDLYISDLAILDCLSNTRAAIQLSPVSNSQVSDGTLKYGLNHVAKELIAKGATVGWNHVVILLEYMADRMVFGVNDYQFDLSNIDSLRIFLMNIQNAAPNWELKFDNFVFTDRQKGNHTGEWESDEACHSTKCTVCEEYTTEYHRYGERVVVKESTETEKGLATETCQVCGWVQQITLGKKPSQSETEPTPDPDNSTDTDPEQQPDDPDSPGTEVPDTDIDLSALGCTGVVGGAWSVITILAFAAVAVRKKDK